MTALGLSPPVTLLSVANAITAVRTHPAAFAATCLLGRTIRFVTIALVPRLAGY